MKITFKQYPEPGEHRLYFCGDTVEFRLIPDVPVRGKAFLRCTIGRGSVMRSDIIERVESKTPLSAREWHDVPMRRRDDGSFSITMALREVGHFEGKCCFFIDNISDPVWPEGANVSLNVEPAEYCCANSIYCAFTRQFGRNKTLAESSNSDIVDESVITLLDEAGYAVIPPSGTFRDLIKELDFIADKLKCRILHLLPVNPTPTLYGRMGRFGSPYASLDFTAVDPALAEFDTKSTPLDQFLELVDAVHKKRVKLFLDIAINHTGWAAKLHEEHPEWLVREMDGTIHSPGAWGVTWGDLTELDHNRLELWKYLADIFLVWCSRGVDGFRCDAGYMIPVPAWEYIISRVRNEYPNTIFLLEGLGGDPAVTLRLLNKANMNWAYSELFQNYSRAQIESYVKYSSDVGYADGLMVHYAETHDNDRLATKSESYARMRTALCALLSSNGAFGFANGVEWFAKEKIDVHEARALNWGGKSNQVSFISKLNTILFVHPAFHNGATLRFIDSGSPSVVIVLRSCSQFQRHLICVINTSCDKGASASWQISNLPFDAEVFINLLSGKALKLRLVLGNRRRVSLKPGQVLCLTTERSDLADLTDARSSVMTRPDKIDTQKAMAMALELICSFNRSDAVCDIDVADSGRALIQDPFGFMDSVQVGRNECRYTRWEYPRDIKREVMVPPEHMLIVTAPSRFRVSIFDGDCIIAQHDSLKSPKVGFFAIFPPFETSCEHKRMDLKINLFGGTGSGLESTHVLFLSEEATSCQTSFSNRELRATPRTFLAGNGRGAIIRPCLEWGELRTRYDALLLANLHTDYPVDRHIMLRRFRLWAVYHAHSQEFSLDNTLGFSLDANGCGVWKFKLPLVNGLFVDFTVKATIISGKNAIRLNICRDDPQEKHHYLDAMCPLAIVVRPDIEDRNFHSDTKASTGPEDIWPDAISSTEKEFSFKPDDTRELLVTSFKGRYIPKSEWSYSIYHSQESARGLEAYGDLFSPGYFKIPLLGGEHAEVLAQILTPVENERVSFSDKHDMEAPHCDNPALDSVLLKAMDPFVVKRDQFQTVIAGYPWFLDWGRDTLIAVRGLVAAGRLDQVRDILLQFAKYADGGTLPNIIHGGEVGNRDTSDAPLWFFKACEDFCREDGSYAFLDTEIRTGELLRDVLEGIAEAYIEGTSNGIKVDKASSLVFSPSHFTWMDTNYPAGTPRSGYPVEIQGLWFASLKFLADISGKKRWSDLAIRVKESIIKYYTDSGRGYLSDCLHCTSFMPPENAVADDHLRPNQLFVLTLGAIDEPALCKSIIQACSGLLVPGAIRSLDDSQVEYQLPVKNGATLVNNPQNPYWGHYEGDEDTKRKPAYHNGTAWTWPFPSFCEAYYMVYGEHGRRTAMAILSSSKVLLDAGCVGQVPEILDGNIPHLQRGCDAQAWGVTELYRVWRLLQNR